MPEYADPVDSTVAVPVKIRRVHVFASQPRPTRISVDAGLGEVFCILGYASEPKLRKMASAAIVQALRLGYEVQTNTNRLTVVCHGGTILQVYFSGGSWGYDIARAQYAPRKAGGTWALGTFEDAVTAAREHARQCYGGVAWEVGDGAVRAAEVPSETR